MPNPLKDAFRRVMRGERLTREETREAFVSMLEGDEGSACAAGLLSSLAVRGETDLEVAGVVDVLRERALRPPVDEGVAARSVDVCGTGGDGLGTFNVSTATAFVVAGSGVPVAKHGGRAVSSRCGSADVLAALGVDVEMSPSHAAEALHRAGVTFLFAPLYHAAMKSVAPLRRELGVRTIFNLAAPLANPVRVRNQIVGVDRPERVEVVARALLALGTSRALVFSNEAAGDELIPIGSTRTAELRNGEVRFFRLDARDFGLSEGEAEHLGGGDVDQNAAILRRILDGEPGTARETVLMNAAAALFVAGEVEDFRDGVSRAARSIDDGSARESLVALAAISRARNAGKGSVP